MIDTEVAIIGAGVAGLAAAAAAAGAGKQVLVVERLGAGGQVMTVERLFPAVDLLEGNCGFELGPLLQEQAERAGASFVLDEVQAIQQEPESWLIRCAGEDVRAKAVIVATGSRRRTLGLPMEQELSGRGLSHCASCDGPLMRGKTVCVVGGGDSAFGEALVLAEYASQVYMLYPESAPIAWAPLVDAVRALPNVTEIPEACAVDILGDVTGVAGVQFVERQSTRELAVNGVFVYVGLQPSTDVVIDLVATDLQGRIITDAGGRTSRLRLYAAGDVRAGCSYRLNECMADGRVAAMSVVADLSFGDRS